MRLELNPTRRTLRQFGFIALMVFGSLSAMAHWEVWMFGGALGPSRELVAASLAAIGLASGLFSLSAPQLNRVLFVALSSVAFPVGFVISHMLFALLFFGMFAPLALVMRWLGRDALQRRARPASESYWVKARPARPLRDYFRQFDRLAVTPCLYGAS